MSSASAAYICVGTSGVHYCCVDISFVVRRGNCQEIIPFIRIVFILLIISGIMQLMFFLWCVFFMSFGFVQQDYIHKVPSVLCDILRHESHKPHGPCTSVTLLRLLCKQPSAGSCVAPIAETH